MSQTQKNYITGACVTGTSTVENRNRSDLSDLVGVYAQASGDQLEEALEAARTAQAEWATYGMERKQAVLMAIGNEMMARAALGTLLSREEGKPLAEGKGEVFRAGQFFTYYAAECLRQLGENADSVRDGIEVNVRQSGRLRLSAPGISPQRQQAGRLRPLWRLAMR